MTEQTPGSPLTCTRCGGPVVVVEDVVGILDWGPAIVDADGVVRPADPKQRAAVVMSDNSQPLGRPRVCCMGDGCGYQWRLRRRFVTYGT